MHRKPQSSKSIKSTIGAEASVWQKKKQLYRDIAKKRGIGHNNNCVCKIYVMQAKSEEDKDNEELFEKA